MSFGGAVMDAILTKGQQRYVALLRIAVGGIFLAAGVQKAFLSVKAFSAAGFLQNATGGTPLLSTPVEGVIYNPTHGFWVALGANTAIMPFVNWLVVFGEIAIGAALILGLATRFAAAMGTLMMVFFLVAAWDFQHGLVNEHLAYTLITGFIGYIGAGRYYGLDALVEKIQVVRQAPQLRYVLG
jgi:thiosulfate dehydrogenase (quinone) large subunit